MCANSVHLVEEAFSFAVQPTFDAQCGEFIGHHTNAPTGCVSTAPVSAINQDLRRSFGLIAGAEGAMRPKLRLRSWRSEEHTSELQSQSNLVCRLLLEKKKIIKIYYTNLLTIILSPMMLPQNFFEFYAQLITPC